MTREAAVRGTVARFFWVNPHAYIYLDVDAPEGVERWALEIESPNLLRHQGWTKETLKAGDQITCKGSRAKVATNHTMKCFWVEMADGRKLQAQ